MEGLTSYILQDVERIDPPPTIYWAVDDTCPMRLRKHNVVHIHSTLESANCCFNRKFCNKLIRYNIGRGYTVDDNSVVVLAQSNIVKFKDLLPAFLGKNVRLIVVETNYPLTSGCSFLYTGDESYLQQEAPAIKKDV